MKNSSSLNTQSNGLGMNHASSTYTELPNKMIAPLTVQNKFNSNVYQPKFLQNSKQYQIYQPHIQFNQNVFVETTTQKSVHLQQDTKTPSSSSHNSQFNQKEVSPTDSDAPYVYMVEKSSKVLTPTAKTTQQHVYLDNNRAPSPQESICSIMSDSSIPSIIRQDITRSNNGFQNAKKQPQNEFKALFNKLNQQQSLTDFNNDKNKLSLLNEEITAKNQLLPAFSFLKSQQFHSNSSYFDNTNTPINLNINTNYSDLDLTYSPKIFQNEGTNSRYSSESSLNTDEVYENNVIQNSTQIEKIIDQDDQDELLLENFIKEHLPPVIVTSEIGSRMASSISSESPFVKISNKKSISNSGSSSSLNSLSKTRANLSRNEKNTLKPPISALLQKSIPSKSKSYKNNTKETPEKAKMKISVTGSNKSLNKISSSVPVVKMTKSAQLRAQLASSNSHNSVNNTINTNTIKKNNKPKQITSANDCATSRAIIKDNLNTRESANSVHYNPHLDHLNCNSLRRKSFTGIMKKKMVADINNSNSISIITSNSKTNSIKPKALWK